MPHLEMAGAVEDVDGGEVAGVVEEQQGRRRGKGAVTQEQGDRETDVRLAGTLGVGSEES